jgi:hypothetical protein
VVVALFNCALEGQVVHASGLSVPGLIKGADRAGAEGQWRKSHLVLVHSTRHRASSALEVFPGTHPTASASPRIEEEAWNKILAMWDACLK